MVERMIRLNFRSKLIVLGALSLTCMAPSVLGYSTVYDVVGWPLPDLAGIKPNIELGDDPVYGRQICPPLTRLNLDEKKSEDLLFKSVRQEVYGGRTSWIYELRTGLYWWRGEPLTSKEVANFIRNELAAVVAVRSGNVWSVKDFEVSATGSQTVKVQFQGAPAFGPYIFNGVPFFRQIDSSAQDSGIRFECVGLYQPQFAPWGLALRPTARYKSHRSMPELDLYPASPNPATKHQHSMVVRVAGNVTSNPATRPPDANVSCSHMIDLPNLLMIVWDNRSPVASRVEFRRAVTQLMPRSALASAGAASLAEAAASPVPRNHPGYDSRLAFQGFDLRAASLALNKLGFRRPSAREPRLNEQGEPLRLVLLTQNKTPGLAEKVILDSFSAVGISVEVKSELADGERVDGMLANFAVDWPRVSYMPYFHSGATVNWPVHPVVDKNIDRDLEKYASSITYAKPDWSLLGAVQRHLVELEPATVILQQKACIDNTVGFKLAKGSISQRNPDWFRQLLF